MRYRILFLLVVLGVVACVRQTDTATTDELASPTAPIVNAEADIQPDGFAGIRIGDPLEKHKDRLTSYSLKNASGDFTVYWIDGANAQTSKAFVHSLTGRSVQTINIVSAEASTPHGISIGSRWADLKAVYPNIVAAGSADNRVYAAAGKLKFRLNAASTEPVLPKGVVTDDTPIIQIGIQ